MRQYRFRRVIECADWPVPVAATVQIEYDATPVYLDAEHKTYRGGIGEFEWRVARVHESCGESSDVNLLNETRRMLESAEGFADDVRAWCLEDYAQREAGPWPDRNI